jgi:phosphodiesterase/alkaline phosphatase D-like protein
MNTPHVKLVTAAAAIGVLLSGSIAAQSSPYTAQEPSPAAKTARVRIALGPQIESADETSAVIRWQSNNPGGSDEHYGVVHYGTSSKELNRTAKSHIRLNRTHSYTVFRVRVDGLAPRTTYYYTVDSMEANGKDDGVRSEINRFRTSAPGERIAAYRPPESPSN